MVRHGHAKYRHGKRRGAATVTSVGASSSAGTASGVGTSVAAAVGSAVGSASASGRSVNATSTPTPHLVTAIHSGPRGHPGLPSPRLDLPKSVNAVARSEQEPQTTEARAGGDAKAICKSTQRYLTAVACEMVIDGRGEQSGGLHVSSGHGRAFLRAISQSSQRALMTRASLTIFARTRKTVLSEDVPSYEGSPIDLYDGDLGRDSYVIIVDDELV